VSSEARKKSGPGRLTVTSGSGAVTAGAGAAIRSSWMSRSMFQRPDREGRVDPRGLGAGPRTDRSRFACSATARPTPNAPTSKRRSPRSIRPR
jgi:hypothetical protein